MAYTQSMYTSRILLYQQDHLEYRFCSPHWDLARKEVSWEDLLQQLDVIDARRCQRLIFTGSSPLAHPRFFDLVEECQRRGLSGFVLETDGSLLATPENIRKLEAAEFRQVYLHFATLKLALHDVIFHEKGLYEQAKSGVENALRSSLDVYFHVPLIKWNVLDIESLLDWACNIQKPKGFLLHLPSIEHVPQKHRSSLLPFSQIAKVSAAIFRKAHYKRVEYGYTVKRGIPPCASSEEMDAYGTVFHDRIAFFKRSRTEMSRVPACEQCVLNNSCPGVEKEYVATFGPREFRPVSLQRAIDWKLRPLNRLEAVDYKQVSDFDNEARNNDMALIRVNGHCNMACSFCFVDRTVGDDPKEQIIAEIRNFVDRGVKHLIVSGGEPTLHPDLPEILGAAKDMGLRSIEMQSNGVRCADMEYAKKLADNGLTMVTVSLHSTDPEHSDDITRLPRAFPKTVEAMHNFRILGVRTQIAHVITKMNYDRLPQYVRYLREEFPEDKGHLSICFAIAQGISDLVFQWVIPRFSEIKPFFKDALDYCLETGIGFGGMIGQGGYPPCMLDGDVRYYAAVMDKIYKSADHDQQFYKPERCKECSFNEHCLGVRQAYVNAYGDEEIQPFQLDEFAPSNKLARQ